MSTIFEFRRGNAQRAEQARGWAVDEYRNLMADLIERAKIELKELRRLAPEALKLIAKGEKAYPRSENDPPNVIKAVADYNNALHLGRQIGSINPISLQNMIDRSANAKPEDFRWFSAKVLADEDRRRLSPLLSGSEFLKKLPMELGVLESFIVEAMNFWAERETHGAGWKPPAATEYARAADHDESEQLDKFDSRL